MVLMEWLAKKHYPNCCLGEVITWYMVCVCHRFIHQFWLKKKNNKNNSGKNNEAVFTSVSFFTFLPDFGIDYMFKVTNQASINQRRKKKNTTAAVIWGKICCLFLLFRWFWILDIWKCTTGFPIPQSRLKLRIYILYEIKIKF